MPAQTTPHRDQPTGFAHDLRENAADQLEKLAEKATDKFRDVADQAEQFAGRVAEQGRDAGEKVQEVVGNFKGAVDKSLKDQPMTTLAMGSRTRVRPRCALEKVAGIASRWLARRN